MSNGMCDCCTRSFRRALLCIEQGKGDGKPIIAIEALWVVIGWAFRETGYYSIGE